MKKLLLAMLCMCGLGLTQAMATDAVNQPALTIYNQNFFVCTGAVANGIENGC